MHDYDVITRIDSLIKSLQGQYSVSNLYSMLIIDKQYSGLKCELNLISMSKLCKIVNNQFAA